MADLVIFGTPKGNQTSQCDADTQKLINTFSIPRTGVHNKMFFRSNNTAHYVLLIYPNPNAKFISADGNENSMFGMDFILRNHTAVNPAKIFNLLQTTYEQYVKNKIIQESPNGDKKWLCNNIATPDNKIAQSINDGMQNLIKNNPEFQNLFGNPNDTIIPHRMTERD